MSAARPPAAFGVTMPRLGDERDGTGVTFRSSPSPQFAGLFQGPERTRTAVDGFAGRYLTTRSPGHGLCHCGCGEPTPPAAKTDARKQLVKGQPVRYIAGHQRRHTFLPILHTASGCWVWQGAVNNKGYPLRGVEGQRSKNQLVHRAEYEKKHGPIPAGLKLHHTCETPRCVNPDHLVALTQGDHNRLHARLRRERKVAAA